VHGVVCCLAPRWRSSSSLSPRLLCAFFQGNCCAYPFRKKKGAIFGMEGVAVNADAG
jgi:hypothetical protein